MEIQYGNHIAYLEAQTPAGRAAERAHRAAAAHRRGRGRRGGRWEQQIEQTRSGYERQVLNDLAEAEKKVAQLAQDLVKAEQKSAERTLRSPIDGTVQQLVLHTVGGVVTPAQQLMVVGAGRQPPRGPKAMISNRDIGFVSPGQQAEVKIDTFNFTRYGLLQGKVVSVSQDAIIREKTGRAGRFGESRRRAVRYQRAGRPGTAVFDADRAWTRRRCRSRTGWCGLAPGMAVTVEIKTGTRRLIEYLMSPLLRYRHESLRER